jgi:hypothetical protein
MLNDWNNLDRTALLVFGATCVWFIKFLLMFLKDIFLKRQGAPSYVTDTLESLVERIETVEEKIEHLCKEPFCPTHVQTVTVLEAVVKKMDINGSKLDGLVATIDTMKELGAIHSHPK